MIKRPEEVAEILKTIDKAGHDVVYAGQCMAASLMGDEALDWDMYTTCPQEKIRELFPDGEAIGKRTTRLDQTTFVESEDLNVADHYDGIIADIVTIDGDIEDQLKFYDFTCEATGEHTNGAAVDPYGGREDAKKKLLVPVGNISERMQKNPEIILKALRYVGLYGFDLSRELFEACQSNADRVQFVNKETVIYEFTTAITGAYAGKFLKMLNGLNLVKDIIGEENISRNPREKKEYKALSERIDMTKRIPLRRLGLFYLVFEKNYDKALAYLPHDEESLDFLADAKRLCPKLHFSGTAEMLKNFIYKFGWDKYNYIDKLLKAQNIVYQLDNQKQVGRDALIMEIIRERQPIFESDLRIDADDIIEAGITDDPERADYLMKLLPAVVHKNPLKNDRDYLLKQAKGFNRSKIKVMARGVDWIR